MPVQIKELGLRALVLQPHGAQEIAKGALAAACGPQHQKVPQVPRVIDHPKERVLLGVRMEPGPTPEVGILLWPRPGGRQPWAEMRQGERVLWGAPHIVQAIARVTGEPGRRRV